jgi:hypothetical protein
LRRGEWLVGFGVLDADAPSGDATAKINVSPADAPNIGHGSSERRANVFSKQKMMRHDACRQSVRGRFSAASAIRRRRQGCICGGAGSLPHADCRTGDQASHEPIPSQFQISGVHRPDRSSV